MAELTINQVVKIVIGGVVIAIVIGGIVLFFNNTFFSFFDNVIPSNISSGGTSNVGGSSNPPPPECRTCGEWYVKLHWCESNECEMLGDQWVGYYTKDLSEEQKDKYQGCIFEPEGDMWDKALGLFKQKTYGDCKQQKLPKT